jgi:hypothetical protein
MRCVVPVRADNAEVGRLPIPRLRPPLPAVFRGPPVAPMLFDCSCGPLLARFGCCYFFWVPTMQVATIVEHPLPPKELNRAQAYR